MIRLEHINIVVRDIPQSLEFYQAAFPSWKVRGEGTGNWHGVDRNWLHLGDDYNYITLNDNGSGSNRDLTTNVLGLAHFAFETNNLDAVISRLKAAGYEIAKQGEENPHRANVYFIDPNGFEVEFVEYFSDIPSERNIYLYPSPSKTLNFSASQKPFRQAR